MKPKCYNPKSPIILIFYTHLLLQFIEPCLGYNRITKKLLLFFAIGIGYKIQNQPLVYELRVSMHILHQHKLSIRKIPVAEKIQTEA